MTTKNSFWSKQKSHKTNETMICTRCNSIEIKQTSTIVMILVGFTVLMISPFTRVFGFVCFGIFAILILSGYRPVMRDCLKCKAKGDKIVPVLDVKGKMLFDQRSAARAKLEEIKFNEYDANEVATDEQLKGFIVEISGVVQSIDKDFTDNIVIQLRSSNEFMPVSLHMVDNQKENAIHLRKGQKIVARCKNFTRIIGSPQGNKCRFL